MIPPAVHLAARCASVVIALVVGGPALAYTDVLRTRAGSVVHWTSPQITVGLDPFAPSRHVQHADVLLAVERAAETWNRIPADQPQLRLTADPRADVMIGFCRGRWPADVLDLGRTEAAPSPVDGHVTAATVELNECDHKFNAPGEVAAERFDLQSVMTHELGHVLGLGHADEAGAIMFPKGRGAGTRMASPADEAGLAIIYLGRESTARPGPSVATASAGLAVVRPSPVPSGARPPGEKEPVVSVPGAPVPPDDFVSVLSFKGDGGRELVLYTCEPTLLPPMAEAPPANAGKRSAKHRRAARVR